MLKFGVSKSLLPVNQFSWSHFCFNMWLRCFRNSWIPLVSYLWQYFSSSNYLHSILFAEYQEYQKYMQTQTRSFTHRISHSKIFIPFSKVHLLTYFYFTSFSILLPDPLLSLLLELILLLLLELLLLQRIPFLCLLCRILVLPKPSRLSRNPRCWYMSLCRRASYQWGPRWCNCGNILSMN